MSNILVGKNIFAWFPIIRECWRVFIIFRGSATQPQQNLKFISFSTRVDIDVRKLQEMSSVSGGKG